MTGLLGQLQDLSDRTGCITTPTQRLERISDGLDGLGIVVCHQNPPLGSGLQRGCFDRAAAEVQGDLNLETGSLAELTAHGDRTTHESEQLLADVQAKTCTAVTTADGSISLPIGLKHILHLVIGHADAGVLNGEQHIHLILLL